MRLIAQDNYYDYYIDKGSAGSFLCPPGHVNHILSVVTMRKGMSNPKNAHGFASVEYAAQADSGFPPAVQEECKRLLAKHKCELTEDYVKQVYAYFKNCYSPDGVDRNASNCIVAHKKSFQKDLFVPPAEHSLAHLCMRKYFPDYPVREDLMKGW